jgi:hypothetical protein
MARFDPTQPLVHPLPDPGRVELRHGLVYTHAGGRELAMDVYLPSGRSPGTRVPAVLLVHGEADPELLRGVRGWGQYTGWGRLLVVRAGRDDPGLNRTIDEFVAAAEQRGLAVELVHQPDGHHAFDVADDTDASRAVIRHVLGFLRSRLGT